MRRSRLKKIAATIDHHIPHLVDQRVERYDRTGKAWLLTNSDFRELRTLFETLDHDGTGVFSIVQVNRCHFESIEKY